MISWFYLKNGKVTGPVQLSDIHKLVESKKIGGFDLIYRSDEKKWKPVVEFEEMQPLFESQEEMVNPDDEVTGSYDMSQLVIPQEKKREKQWVVLRILDRHVRPVKTEQLGPFTTDLIKKMIRQGDLSFQDYVWTDGMKQWGLLVEEEELVPRVELPSLVETLTVEDTVQVPEESGEELLESVEVTQPGVVVQEMPPKEASTEDLVTESRSLKSKPSKGDEPAPDRISEFKIISLDETDKKSRPPKRKKTSSEKVRSESRSPRIPEDSPYREKPESDWSFRLLQGVFGAFVIGGIVGIAFFISHGPGELGEMVFRPDQEPQVETPKVPPPVTEPVTPPAEAPKPPPPQVVEKPPPPPVKKAATYVKFAMKNISGSRPRVEVLTDASHHFPAEFLLTAAAGQILTHPSYHREWTVENFDERFRLIDFRSLGLKDGWYTLLVKVGDQRALKTFFIGRKKTYNSKIRSYRKALGYQHQEEKEELYFVLKDLVENLAGLSQAKGAAWSPSMAKAETSLRQAQRAVSSRLRNKNSHLWTVYWIQIRDKSGELDEALKKLNNGSNQGVRGFEKDFRQLLGQVQNLRVVN